MDPQAGVPGDHVEVRVLVQEGRALADGDGSDEAVD